MVNPKKMCTRHLLGEHLECHMFAGSISKGIKMDGYISNKLLEIQSLNLRHNDLAKEIKRRKFEKYGIAKEHKSMLKEIDTNYCKQIKIDINENEKELCKRCEDCKKRIINYSKIPKLE